MFAVMKTFVTVISASTGRNDFIFDIWLLHGDLYRVSPFQVYRTSTSDECQTTRTETSPPVNKGNNKITELRTILQKESQNS